MNRSGGGGMSPRKRAWIGFTAVVLLFFISLGFALPQAWQKVGLPGLSRDGFRLGLDLQGGTHLVYETDMSQIPPGERGEALQGVRDVIERRVNAFGVSEPVVQTIQSGTTHRVVVELAGVLDVNEAINQIGETPILEFKEPGSDSGALSDEQKAELDAKQAQERAVVEAAFVEARRTGSFPEGFEVEALSNVAPTHPLYGPFVSRIVNDRVGQGRFFTEENGEGGVSLIRYDSRKSDTQWLASHILICFEGKTGCAGEDAIPAIEANIRSEQALDGLTAENFIERAKQFSTDGAVEENGGDLSWVQPGVLPSALELALRALPVGGVSSSVVESDYGYHILHKRDEQPITTYELSRVRYPLTLASDIAADAAWVNTPLSGKQLKRAGVEFDQTGAGQPYVSITFDAEGDKLFGDLTSRLVRQPIGIFLDGELISAPIVQQAIYGGQAQITGNFTVDEAKTLAQRLNAGALPVPIELLSQQTVGPTLGANSLSRSLTAGLIGFLLVAIFMLIYYRLPGVLAVVALALYGVLNLAAYKLFGITMTLAGIAGFILSVGMAVDANVLIFERLKEELRAGRDLPRAIEQGFARAWTSIRDGNVTTLIAAAILFFFSTSFIKGFAVTLTIGVLLSMFSAIIVTRTFLRLVSLWSVFKSTRLYGVRKAEHV